MEISQRMEQKHVDGLLPVTKERKREKTKKNEALKRNQCIVKLKLWFLSFNFLVIGRQRPK